MDVGLQLWRRRARSRSGGSRPPSPLDRRSTFAQPGKLATDAATAVAEAGVDAANHFAHERVRAVAAPGEQPLVTLLAVSGARCALPAGGRTRTHLEKRRLLDVLVAWFSLPATVGSRAPVAHPLAGSRSPLLHAAFRTPRLVRRVTRKGASYGRVVGDLARLAGTATCADERPKPPSRNELRLHLQQPVTNSRARVLATMTVTLNCGEVPVKGQAPAVRDLETPRGGSGATLHRCVGTARVSGAPWQWSAWHAAQSW